MTDIREPSQKIENDDKAAVSMMELCKPAGTIDTFHNDEGLKVLAEYDGDQAWEPSEEKSLVRKVDLRLLPLMCGTYAMSYYDKVMISQAVCISPALVLSSAVNYLHHRPYSAFGQISTLKSATAIRLQHPSTILASSPAPIQRSSRLKDTQSSALQHL
jgi:hypothetical protein